MNNQKEGETVSGTERKQKFVLSDIFFMHVQYFALIKLKLRLQLQFLPPSDSPWTRPGPVCGCGEYLFEIFMIFIRRFHILTRNGAAQITDNDPSPVDN